MNQLKGVRVAMLVATGFEEEELLAARRALQAAGATTELIALEPGTVRAWEHDHFGAAFSVDCTVTEAAEKHFDALVLPGGILGSEHLRRSPAAVRLVRSFVCAAKPVAAIGQGVQTMIDAGVVRDRTLTSYPSLRRELVNAGANWVDAAVVVDRRLVTCRSADELDAFTERMVDEFAESAPT